MQRLVRIVFASFFLACAPEPGAEAPARPDVLLVVIDTLRADRVSAYGYARPTTPQLDALALGGVLFEDVTAPAPWTWPSHASLFTGEPPWVHGARLASSGGDDAVSSETADRFGMPASRMRDDLPTLAERFSEAGYRSVALVANDWLDPQLGLLRGFEHAALFENDGALIEAAAREMAKPDDRPLFLFLNAMTAHSPFCEGPGPWALGDDAFLDPARAPDWVRPYLTEEGPRGVHLAKQPPGEETSAELRFAAGELAIAPEDLARIERLYDASVRGADFVLSRVVEAWAAKRPASVVAVTSDHGEAFGEHELLGHAASVYPEVLAVPLVIVAPGRLPAGRRVAEPVELRDLHPTLLALAGLDGGARSLAALAAGGSDEAPEGPIRAASERNPAYVRLAGPRFDRDFRLHRDGDHALVWSKHDPGFRELYDLAADPAMSADLAAEAPDRADRMVAEARERLAREGEAPDRALAIPEDVAAQLRSLGYADRVAAP